MSEWISVEDVDRHPPESMKSYIYGPDDYSVSDLILLWGVNDGIEGEGEPLTPPFVGYRYHWHTVGDKESGWSARSSTNGNFTATHWMPLPEPPQ